MDSMKGSLYKWTNYLRGYQKRWFVLQNGLVSYYRNQSEVAFTCRGTINLANASVCSTGSITFVISNSSTQTFHLKANSEHEQKMWVSKLKSAKSRALSLRKGDDSDMYVDSYEDEDYKNSSVSEEDGVRIIQDSLMKLEARLGDLQRHQETVFRKGDDLQKSITEFESARDPAELMQRHNFSRDRASAFKVASMALVNSYIEFAKFTRSQVTRWQRIISNQGERCAHLERMVEELAKQLRQLEHLTKQNNNQIPNSANSLNSAIYSGSSNKFFDRPPGQAIRVTNISKTGSANAIVYNSEEKTTNLIEDVNSSANTSDNTTINRSMDFDQISSDASPSSCKSSTLGSPHTNDDNNTNSNSSNNDVYCDEYNNNNNSSDDNFYDAEEENAEFSITLPDPNAIGNTIKTDDRQRRQQQQQQRKSHFNNKKSNSIRSTSGINFHEVESSIPVTCEVDYEYESDVVDDDDDDDDDDEENGFLVTKHKLREARVIQPKFKKGASRSSTLVSSNGDQTTSCQLKNTLNNGHIMVGKSNVLDQCESFVEKRLPMIRRQSIRPKPNISLNLWSIMKNCIGKELTKIPMPVNFSEPLSMLQRLTEDFEYSACLDRAAACQDSLEQMAYVAAFTVSAYATTAIRTNKPFNPLLGETFECDRTDDMGWRSLAEQVSHHPPACALHCESNSWYCWFEFSMTTKFRGKYLQINPVGTCHLVFRRSGHHYSWRKIPMTVHNIIVGRLWIDNSGEMDIVNHNTGEKCHLSYKAYSYFSNEKPRRVTGAVLDKYDSVRYVLNGTWDDSMECAPVLSTRQARNGKPVLETGPASLLWQSNTLLPDAERMYYFTRFALQLSEMEPNMCPTDCRFRPDQRLMEDGQWDEANRSKVYLEELQRQRRRQMALELSMQSSSQSQHPKVELDSSQQINSDDNSKTSELSASYISNFLDTVDIQHKPLWFSREWDSNSESYTYIFTGKYWQNKVAQNWAMCPNIYSST